MVPFFGHLGNSVPTALVFLFTLLTGLMYGVAVLDMAVWLSLRKGSVYIPTSLIDGV